MFVILQLIKYLSDRRYLAGSEVAVFHFLPTPDIPQRLVPGVPGPSVLSPAEIRNMFWGDRLTENIAANPGHGPGIERCIDSGPRVIAHKQSAFLTGREPCSRRGVIDVDDTRIILHIGSRCTRAEITPLPDHRVAKIAIVPLVGKAKNDGILDLAARDGSGAERGRAVDLRAHFDGGAFPAGKRPADHTPFHDLRMVADVDRPGPRIQQTMRNPDPLFYKDFAFAGQSDGRRERHTLSSGGDQRVVFGKRCRIVLKNVPGVADQALPGDQTV